MRLTAICVFLAATGFTVAQTGPSVYQDFSGLFHYLTSSVDEATGKVKAQDPKNPLVLKVSHLLPRQICRAEQSKSDSWMIDSGRWEE